MAKTREILNRINSIISTKKITQAMKMVSVSKLAKVQEKAGHLKIYSEKLTEIISDIEKTSSLDLASEYFNSSKETDTKKNNKILIILITSDRGLCSSFNTNLLKKTLEFVKNLEKENKEFSILTIGKKGNSFFNKYEYPLVEDYINILSSLTFEIISPLAEKFTKMFKNGEYTEIYIASNSPKGKAERIISINQYLPLKGIKLNKDDISKEDLDDSIIYEPKKELILNQVIPKVLKLNFYSALINSVTAEHSARMMAMTKATDNADEMIKELKLTYNRTRQDIITKELTEIVGGAEALKGEH